MFHVAGFKFDIAVFGILNVLAGTIHPGMLLSSLDYYCCAFVLSSGSGVSRRLEAICVAAESLRSVIVLML